jgi:hypothetical protein
MKRGSSHVMQSIVFSVHPAPTRPQYCPPGGLQTVQGPASKMPASGPGLIPPIPPPTPDPPVPPPKPPPPPALLVAPLPGGRLSDGGELLHPHVRTQAANANSAEAHADLM